MAFEDRLLLTPAVVRRVGTRSLGITIPAVAVRALGIEKGDTIRISITEVMKKEGAE